MSDPDAPPSQPAPPRTPGERRLAHPPSDRYRAAEDGVAAAETTDDPSASVARGVALAVVAAAVGAGAIVTLGGILTVTEGLVVIAAATGWGVAAALRFGAGSHLAGRRRARIALVIAVVAVAAAQLGLWQYARLEGGVLSPIEYLWEVFGVLVVIEVGVAAVLAWVVGR